MSDTIVPPAIIIWRSATGSRFAVRCSKIMIVVPCFALSSSRMPARFCAAAASIPENGSSSTRMDGRRATTEAIATRWRSPQERPLVDRQRRWLIQRSLAVSPILVRISWSGRFWISRPNAISLSTSPVTSWYAGSWNTIPTYRAKSGVIVLSGVHPADDHVPLHRAFCCMGDKPVQAAGERGLPGTALTGDKDTFAGPDCEIDMAQGSDLPSRQGSGYRNRGPG